MTKNFMTDVVVSLKYYSVDVCTAWAIDKVP